MSQCERSELPYFAVRGSLGLDLIEIKGSKAKISQAEKISDKPCRVMEFSKTGSKLAWCDGEKIQVMDIVTKEIQFSKDLSRTFVMSFSPDENFLTTWEPYAVTKEFPQGKCNFQIWNLSRADCVYEAVQKKMDGWKPEWIESQNICAKQFGNTVNFYKSSNFAKVASKLHIDKLESFALSPNKQSPTRIACFIRGGKGSPSSVRLFKYPRFSHGDMIASKSFFKADSVEMFWNKQGTSLLIKTATEVDASGESYYGEQNLHFLNSKGDSAIVALSKKGPIYDSAWAPAGNQFVVVFGFMPAKACIFNLKCDSIFEFGPTPKNLCYFNPHGNLLALAGFGNLRGNIEVWDFEKQQQVAQFQSPDTTHFEWCSDGEHFITATTAPRLRVGNGYKLWHYKDGVCLERKSERELHQVAWQPKPEGTYNPPVVGQVSKREIKAIISASKPASYVPPHARGNPSYTNHLKNELNGVTQEKAETKSAQRRRKKKEKEAKESTGQGPTFSQPTSSGTSEQQDAVAMAKYLLGDASSQSQTNAPAADVNRRIKNLRKKLNGIEKLKASQKEGKELNEAQIEKVNSEASVRQILQELEIQSNQ